MKSIIKFLLAVLLVTGSFNSFATPLVNIKLNTAEIVDRHLSGFHEVNVGGSFDVYIIQGNTESVKVEAPADVMNHIITEVNGGVLKIYNKNHDGWNWGEWLFGHHKKIVIYVTAKSLSSVNLSGSGDVYFKEGLTANSLRISLSGSGDLSGKVNVKKLESSLSGSGDVRLSGHADESAIKVVGSGDFNARELSTVNTSVSLSGSGDAYVNASEKIDAAVHGSGDIHYNRTVKSISSSKTGSGDISRF